MAFNDRLLEDGAGIRIVQREHPFVVELAEGTLDEAAFRHWVKQDHRYLFDFAGCSPSRERRPTTRPR